MAEDDPVFEKGLEKLYYLSALDAVNGVGVLAHEADAAQLAYDLITDWRWDLAVAGKHVGIGPEPPQGAR